MDNNDDLDDQVQDLVQQLSDNNKNLKKSQKEEEFTLDKENLEAFLLNKAGKLINDSLSMVDIVKQYVESAPNAEDVASLSDLLKATTSSIDTLSKILVQNKRSETSIATKMLDINSKKELQQTDHEHKLELTREEVLDRLILEAEVITDKVEELTDKQD
jgi:hypothetical protein